VPSSTGRAAPPQPSPGGGPEGQAVPRSLAGRVWGSIARGLPASPAGLLRRPRWDRNGYATAALVTGALGVALVTIPVSLAFGVLGLLRARGGGPGAPGRVRSWLGIGLALGWTVLAGFLMPHLVRAADPGCVAYKGPALAAYQRVVDDFRAGTVDAVTARDLTAAIRQLREAAAASRSTAASRSLTALSTQLRTVLAEVQAGTVVPRGVLRTLNHDSAHADKACGTVRL
jgi:hypothetical protein